MLSAAPVEFGDLITPVALAAALPWMLAFAWVARRLLGLGPGRWSSTIVAGVTGWLGAGAVTLLVVRRTSNTGTILAVNVASAILFTMIAVVALDLASRRQVASVPGGIPHPIRSVRNRVARVRRYAQVLHIAAGHGLRVRRGEDPARLPARQVRLAFEEAGCMFVKLGQMLAARSDVVGPAMASEFAELRENVPPASADEVDLLLQEELGRRSERSSEASTGSRSLRLRSRKCTARRSATTDRESS